LLSIDLTCQQRRLFGVGIDFHVVEQFTMKESRRLRACVVCAR
jgi:hypothetical protein